MIVEIPGFDLPLTAASGQSFRFVQRDGGAYSLIAKGHQVTIHQTGRDRFDFSCTPEEFASLWHDYFDLDTDYSTILNLVPPDGSYLHRAVLYAGGIRILRQEPFETLISFIISQRKNIPAIQFCVNQLCSRFGEAIGENAFAFPAPEALAGASMEELAGCSLGYRAKYIQQTARMIASAQVGLDSLHPLPDDELQAALTGFPGVGEKVAACVMLFAYRRMDAFPVDVWIKRVLQTEYPDGFPFGLYKGSAGMLQQMLFCYARSQAVKVRPAPQTCKAGNPTV